MSSTRRLYSTLLAGAVLIAGAVVYFVPAHSTTTSVLFALFVFAGFAILFGGWLRR